MINCPKCQVPNPDNATACAACGTALVGQQFAMALDQAMGGPPTDGAMPGSAPPAFPGVPYPEAPLMPAMDPSMAQAEINKFMLEQRAKRRTRSIIYLVIAVAIIGVAVFFGMKSSRRKALKESVGTFYLNFDKLDNETIGTFWKCTVRADNIDIHKATDTLQLTDGLEKAFTNYPKGQPGWLRDKCIPMLSVAGEELDKLKGPSDFTEGMDAMKSALKEVQSVFERYTATIEKRKNEAADEQEVRNMVGDFHNMVEQKDAPKALAYFNMITCAVPDVVKMAKGVTKPPDTQELVEYIYNTCKADPKFADKLRRDCFTTRNDNTKKTPEFNLLVNRMAGDARDLEAINDCFKRANRGFAREEIEAVAKIFIKYAEARGKVRAAMAKLKQELAD